MGLETKSCVPCEAGTPPLGPKEIKEYVSQVGEWEVVGDTAVRRRFTFKNFREAMAFVNRVADIAETEGHHPDIKIVYNRVTIDLTTHAIGGLSENDFIVAAKIDGLAP